MEMESEEYINRKSRKQRVEVSILIIIIIVVVVAVVAAEIDGEYYSPPNRSRTWPSCCPVALLDRRIYMNIRKCLHHIYKHSEMMEGGSREMESEEYMNRKQQEAEIVEG